jgi:hypothetical protein
MAFSIVIKHGQGEAGLSKLTSFFCEDENDSLKLMVFD